MPKVGNGKPRPASPVTVKESAELVAPVTTVASASPVATPVLASTVTVPAPVPGTIVPKFSVAASCTIAIGLTISAVAVPVVEAESPGAAAAGTAMAAAKAARTIFFMCLSPNFFIWIGPSGTGRQRKG